MFRSLAIASTCLLIGEVIADGFAVPVPGAIVGMMLLATTFAVRGGPDQDSARLFDCVSPHFSLFFVPAAVGVVASFEMLAIAWVHIVAAILLSTALTIGVTGWVAQSLFRAFRGVQQA